MIYSFLSPEEDEVQVPILFNKTTLNMVTTALKEAAEWIDLEDRTIDDTYSPESLRELAEYLSYYYNTMDSYSHNYKKLLVKGKKNGFIKSVTDKISDGGQKLSES